MAYPVILTGSGTALCAAPFQMLLTCDSSLLVRQTRVCRRRLYVPRLKPRVICVTFHGGCGHFLKTTRKEKGSWICLGKLFEFWGAASPMFWDPRIVYDFLQTSSSLTFSLPRPELRTTVLGPPPGLPGLAPQPPTSGCQTGSVFSDKRSKSHSGSPLGAAACLPASQAMLASLSTGTPWHVSWQIHVSFSNENEALLWSSLLRSLLGWHLSDRQQGLKMF